MKYSVLHQLHVDVDWSHRAAHMFKRHGLRTWTAEEALADPVRVVIDPDYASRSGSSVRIIGYSSTLSTAFTVIVIKRRRWTRVRRVRLGIEYERSQHLLREEIEPMNAKITDLIAAEVEAAEEADNDFDAPLPASVKVTRGHDRTRVLQVRLNEDEHRLISELAEDEHLPASTYARAILLKTIGS